MALSLGSKETAVALPAALLLLDAVAGPRPFSWRRGLAAVSPHALVLALAAGAFLASPAYGRMVSRGLEIRGPGANLLTQVDALAWLAGQVVRLDRLNADPALPAVTSLSPSVALAGLGLLAALAAGLALLRRRPAIAFGLLWFLLWLPPAGWWLPRPDPASERQLYLALLGPSWLAGLALAPWLAAGGIRRVAVVALVAALGTATALRNRVYRDEVAFWEDVASKSPQNPRAHNNLGVALASRCRTTEAEASFRRALEADPRYFRAAVNVELLAEGKALGPRAPPCPAMR
jgi:tetratricopeptide (TPR) repeat protein